MGNITVRIIPHAEYKGKKIVKVGEWYKVKGTALKAKSLIGVTDLLK